MHDGADRRQDYYDELSGKAEYDRIEAKLAKCHNRHECDIVLAEAMGISRFKDEEDETNVGA